MDRIIFLANRSVLESSMTLDLRIQWVRKRAVNSQEVPGVELGHVASVIQGGPGSAEGGRAWSGEGDAP